MPESGELDVRPVRAFLPRAGLQVDESLWPASVPAMAQRLHELSHGEGFLEILRTRVNQIGFYLMDEPDAPLSFTASLGLVALLHDLVAAGSQVVVATHSPIVAALPGANPARARAVGRPPRDLGRPGPGHLLAAVHAGPAIVFPAPVRRTGRSALINVVRRL